MSRFVRQSKYRHIFGDEARPENQFTELRISKNAWDSNSLAANPYFMAVNWNAGGGGAFAILPYSAKGKLPTEYPLYTGHRSAVLDCAFNPFNDYIVASASEDCTIKIWGIPENGPTETVSESLVTLNGHGRKVGHLLFHPSASNVLASNSTDLSIKLWDIEKGQEKLSMTGHADMINDFSWNYDGSLMCSVSKDKKVKVWDVRTQNATGEAEGHPGVKGARCVWLGQKDKFFTVGFSKNSERQYKIFDPRNIATPLHQENIDSAAGILMPFYDDDTNVLALAGKGDGNIRFYEIVDEKPHIFFLTEHKSTAPQKGMCAMTKRAVDVSTCEIMRLFKATEDTVIPISIKVPRKADVFQEDLFPDTPGGEPALTADAWFGGQTSAPIKVSLRGGFQRVEAVTFTPSAPATPAAASTSSAAATPAALQKQVADLQKQVAEKDAEIARLTAEVQRLTTA